MNNKVLNTLGICACAKKISYGETLLKDIKNKKVYLVIVANDASENSKKRLIDKCVFYKCEYKFILNKESISKAIGRLDLVSAVGIKDFNLVKKIKEGPVFICHGDCIEDVKFMQKLLKEKYDVEVDEIVNTGPVIGAHSGPGTLALFFVGKQR